MQSSPKKTIGVDAREIQHGVITGIGRALINFIRYFEKFDKENELVLFSETRLPIHLKGNIRRVERQLALPTIVWDQIVLPFLIRKAKVDLFYSPYYKAPIFTTIPVVTQVLDLMYLVFEPYRKRLGILGLLYYFTIGRAFSIKANSVITDSEHAKNDIIQLWKLKPQKIKVFPLGCSNRYRPVKDQSKREAVRKRLNLPQNYILYFGNFKPHKNVKILIEAFERVNRIKGRAKLVLAGPLDKYGQGIQKLVSKKNLTDQVVFTGTVRESDSPETIYSMADIFVCPTLYEGFGLPALEAMACGTPVITSNTTAVPEVVGSAGVLVDPHSPGEITSAMLELLQNSIKRKAYSKAGLERAKHFGEKHAAEMVYRHLLEKVGG